MEIKKVLNLSEEEFNALIKSGEILGSIREKLTTGAADELNLQIIEIISALKKF